jgi:hypothetical protein
MNILLIFHFIVLAKHLTLKMKAHLLLPFLFFISLKLIAQNQPRPNPYGHWSMYFGDNKLNQQIGIHSEAQLRNYFVPKTLEQTLLRTGINWYVDSLNMVTAGYAFIYTKPSSENLTGSTMSEHRIWEQFVMRYKNRFISLEHRYRLEHRFIENITTATTKFENRVRYRLLATVPLSSISNNLKPFILSSYNELFLNLGKKISGQFFDRNRLYIAIGYQVNSMLNFQFGYLNQVISIPGIEHMDINHNLQLSIIYNPNLSAKY